MQKSYGAQFALAVLFSVAPPLALAQPAAPDAAGTIAGKVVDQSGAMVSSVQIQLKSASTGETQKVAPYIAGLYRFTSLKPGFYSLRLQAEGFSDFELPKVEVKPEEVTRVDVSLQLSNLNTEITVKADDNKTSHTSALLGDVPVVEAATLRTQTLEEAPANVTVITAAEIKVYGWRTLGEALSSARGFYFTNDGIYQYGGVRGLNVPGDYNSRFLVMINGHPMTENIYNSNGFYEQDFNLDMDLVERIEIVRGPSTTLYGSNGILANINVVTKLPVDQAGLKVSTEYGSFNEKKLHFSTATKLWKDATLLVSASVFNGGGRDIYIPAYNTPQTNNGIANNADWDRGYHAFIDFNWNDFRVTGMLGYKEIAPPVSWGNSVFNTQGNRVKDGRDFVEASYTHNFSSGSTFRWRLAYDNYRYTDQFYYATSDPLSGEAGPLDNQRTFNLGDWVDTRLSYTFQVGHIGELTVGASSQFDIRAVQAYYDVPTNAQLFYVNRPDRTEGVFAQQEIKISKELTAYVGGRYDFSRNYSGHFSPQASIVYTPTDRTIIKGVYGAPFRNPSTFEQYYGDGVQYIPSGGLKQETAQVFEGSVERKVTPKWSVLANYYFYQINHIIESITIGTAQQYVNSPSAFRTQGIEFEVSGRPQPWIQIVGSYGYGAARDVASGLWLQNSPRQLGKARVAFPLFRDKVHFATATQYIGRSLDANNDLVRQAMLVDLTLNTSRINRSFDVTAGVRNALGWTYSDPSSLILPQIPQPRQTFFVKVVYHSDKN